MAQHITTNTVMAQAQPGVAPLAPVPQAQQPQRVMPSSLAAVTGAGQTLQSQTQISAINPPQAAAQKPSLVVPPPVQQQPQTLAQQQPQTLAASVNASALARVSTPSASAQAAAFAAANTVGAMAAQSGQLAKATSAVTAGGAVTTTVEARTAAQTVQNLGSAPPVPPAAPASNGTRSSDHGRKRAHTMSARNNPSRTDKDMGPNGHWPIKDGSDIRPGECVMSKLKKARARPRKRTKAEEAKRPERDTTHNFKRTKYKCLKCNVYLSPELFAEWHNLPVECPPTQTTTGTTTATAVTAA